MPSLLMRIDSTTLVGSLQDTEGRYCGGLARLRYLSDRESIVRIVTTKEHRLGDEIVISNHRSKAKAFWQEPSVGANTVATGDVIAGAATFAVLRIFVAL